MATNKSEREYRSMTLAVEQREEGGEAVDNMTVSGYATTFDDPYLLYTTPDNIEVWESVDASAFDNCDMSDVIMQYNHEGRVFARIKNNTLTVRPDEKGLFVKADLGGTDIGRGLYQEIKGGYTDQMSFGFVVEEDEKEVVEEQNKTIIRRFIRKVSKLFDVSAVSIPANPNTVLTSVRSFDGAIESIRAERLERQAEELKRERIAVRAKALGGKK